MGMTSGPQAGVNQQIAELHEKVRRLFSDDAVASVPHPQEVRDHILAALSSGKTTTSYVYRHLPEQFPLECHIRSSLRFFVNENAGEAPYERAIPDLKLIRRTALRRFAFELAYEVNEKLATLEGDGFWQRVWLWKDLMLLRIALALPLGYGVVLGTSNQWIWELRRRPLVVAVATLILLALAWLLMYFNVRDQIGHIRASAGEPGILQRTGRAFLISLTWSTAYTIAAAIAAYTLPELRQFFEWKAAILTSAAALCVAVLVQFFFESGKSIADPL